MVEFVGGEWEWWRAPCHGDRCRLVGAAGKHAGWLTRSRTDLTASWRDEAVVLVLLESQLAGVAYALLGGETLRWYGGGLECSDDLLIGDEVQALGVEPDSDRLVL